MRVLIAIHGFPPTHQAGAERAGERIAQWLAKNGHEVGVFAVERVDDPEFRVETTQENGITIYRLFYDIKAGDNLLTNTYENKFIAQAFRDVLKNNSYELVHMVSGYLLGGQIIHISHEFNLPIVVTLTEYWFMCARLNLLFAEQILCTGPETDYKCARCLLEEKRRFRLPRQHVPMMMEAFWKIAQRIPFAHIQTGMIHQRRISLQTALDAADLVICPSHFIFNKFSEYGFDTKRYTVLTHGLNAPEMFMPRLSNSQLRIGYTGQIKPHKGVHLLVKAVKALLDDNYPVILDIWGAKPRNSGYMAELEAGSSAYPAIRWRGGYSGDQLWDIVSAYDVMVVPSCWYENSPTVILEAFKARVPVVATNLGGMAEMIRHETNGLLFELNDTNSLKEQLQRLVMQPALLHHLRSGISRVKNADDEVSEIFQHYLKLVKPIPDPQNQ